MVYVVFSLELYTGKLGSVKNVENLYLGTCCFPKEKKNLSENILGSDLFLTGSFILKNFSTKSLIWLAIQKKHKKLRSQKNENITTEVKSFNKINFLWYKFCGTQS